MSHTPSLGMPGGETPVTIFGRRFRRHHLRRTKLCLVILALTCSSETGSAGEPPLDFELRETQETESFLIRHFFDPETLVREIWLTSRQDPAVSALLFRHERYATVLVSPDEKKILINNYPTTSGGGPRLFVRGEGLEFHEAPDANMIEKLRAALSTRERVAVAEMDKYKAEALEWASDSQAVLVVQTAEAGSMARVSGWFCVFDFKKSTVSTDLRPMNRNSVVAGEPFRLSE